MSVQDEVIQEFYNPGWTVTAEEVAISLAYSSHDMKGQLLADQIQTLVQANLAIEADEYIDTLTLEDLTAIVEA